MTLNLQDRRIVSALAAVFMLGLACVLLLVLAVLTLCAMLLNALVGTIGEIFSTIGTFYSHTGPVAHLVILLGVLFGVPYSFKKIRLPLLRSFQRQFMRFSTFAQHQQPSSTNDPGEDERDYEEGEVIDLDAKENSQARTTAGQPHSTSKRTTTTAKKQRKQHNKKRPRHASPTRAALTLTHA